MPFGFQLAQDFIGELIVALIIGLARALDAGLDSRRIEDLDGLVPQRLLESLRQFRAVEKRW